MGIKLHVGGHFEMSPKLKYVGGGGVCCAYRNVQGCNFDVSDVDEWALRNGYMIGCQMFYAYAAHYCDVAIIAKENDELVRARMSEQELEPAIVEVDEEIGHKVKRKVPGSYARRGRDYKRRKELEVFYDSSDGEENVVADEEIEE